MALTKYKLGELLERNNECNENLTYGVTDVRGVLNTKGIAGTKVSVDDRDLRKFLVVRPGGFIFNHRVHDKLGLGYNTSNDVYIFTNDYVSFYVKPEVNGTILLPDYLYMWYLRPEFDRYMLYKTYGSATLFFNWDNMCELEIKLPDVSVQQKYVDIYKSMVANQEAYERGLEDLKLTIDAELERIKHNAKTYALNSLAKESDDRNENGAITAVHGVNKDKLFMPSVTSGDDLTKYKLVKPMQLACNLMHVGRDAVVPIALNTSDSDIIVSPAYTVFESKTDIALPEYILMWLSRDETDRYAWFLCDNSVSGMEKKRFFEICIPCPDIETQRAVVELHDALSIRRNICATIKQQIKDICPVLIKGSMED